MLNHRQYGFSSKNLCTRPRSGPCTRAGTPLNGIRTNWHDIDAEDAENDAAATERREVDRLEQQLRDALFARTTAHLGEQRILKNAFNKFDKDCSGHVDFIEFQLALEHLGLHTEAVGLKGQGGLPVMFVKALFRRYDVDDSGSIDYDEFCNAVLQPDKMHKML